MKLGVAEILGKIANLKTKEEKIAALRHVDNFAIRTVLQGAYDKNIKWLLPPGEVPYKKNDLKDLESVLYSEIRKLYLFIEGGNPNLKQLRRETLFIELLESIAPADAELLASIKDKKLPYKGITEAIVKEAFPGLINEQDQA